MADRPELFNVGDWLDTQTYSADEREAARQGVTAGWAVAKVCIYNEEPLSVTPSAHERVSLAWQEGFSTGVVQFELNRLLINP